MSTIKTREEIKDEYKWDLTTVFKDKNDFENFYNDTKKLIEDFTKYEGHVMDSSESLLEVIEKDNEISRRIDKLYSYTSMLSDQDVSNNNNQELLSKVMNLYDLAIKNSYFINPEILKADESTINKYIDKLDKLKEYKRVLEKIYRYKDHTLSDAEERLLSNLSKAFGNDEATYSFLTDSDLTYGTIKDEEGNDIE